MLWPWRVVIHCAVMYVGLCLVRFMFPVALY